MKKFNVKILYTLLIIAGAALVVYEQSREANQNVFILSGGFILLMYGLYKATTQWVKDNKEPDTEEEAVFFDEDEE